MFRFAKLVALPSLCHFPSGVAYDYAVQFYPSTGEILLNFRWSSISDLSGREDLTSFVFEGDEFCLPTNVHARFFKNCSFSFQADLTSEFLTQ